MTRTTPDPAGLGARRAPHTLVVVLLLAAVALVAPAASALAQAPGTPFPAPLVAPVRNGDDVGATLDIRGIWRIDNTDPANPVLGVGFASPLTPPTEDYRVSILLGDPAGARTRVSYVAGADAGTVETSTDGETWETTGTTTASVNAVGAVELTVPVADQPDGSQVWAEAQDGDDQLTTPVFALDSLLGRSVDGGMPTSSRGEVTDGAGIPTGAVIDLGPGPILSIVGSGITVDYAAAPPTELDGTAVTGVVDRVLLAPNFDDGATTTDAIEIDRTAQTVALVDGFTDPPSTPEGASTSFFLGGFPPDGVGPLTFDLSEVAESLGFPTAPDTVGAGLERTVTLDDGRVVQTTAVLGTLDWFGTVAGESTPTTTVAGSGDDTSASTDDDEETQRQILTVAAAALAGVLALAGIALIASARRKRHGHRILGEHADDRGVVDWTAEMEAVRLDGDEAAPAEVATVGREEAAGGPSSGAPVDDDLFAGAVAADAPAPVEPEPEGRSKGRGKRRTARAEKAARRAALDAPDDGPGNDGPGDDGPGDDGPGDGGPGDGPGTDAPADGGPGDHPGGDDRRADTAAPGAPVVPAAPSTSAAAPPAPAADDPLSALEALIGDFSTRLEQLPGDDDPTAR